MVRRLAMLLALLPVACRVPPPQVSSMYTGTGAPRPKHANAPIEVFMAGSSPRPGWEAIGIVEVATDRDERSLDVLLDYARREAQRLGGDALIDVTYTSGASGSSTGVAIPFRGANGGVLGYVSTSHARTRRAIRGTVVRWAVERR